MGSSSSKSTENSPANENDAGSDVNRTRVFDDGVGRKLVQPFFSAEPTEEVLKLVKVTIIFKLCP
jgi:hypothetical protein